LFKQGLSAACVSSFRRCRRSKGKQPGSSSSSDARPSPHHSSKAMLLPFLFPSTHHCSFSSSPSSSSSSFPRSSRPSRSSSGRPRRSPSLMPTLLLLLLVVPSATFRFSFAATNPATVAAAGDGRVEIYNSISKGGFFSQTWDVHHSKSKMRVRQVRECGKEGRKEIRRNSGGRQTTRRVGKKAHS